MKRIAIISASLALLGCVAPPAPPGHSSAGVKRCLPLNAIVGRSAAPPNAIFFEVVGPADYRNELAQNCRSIGRLGPAAAFAFENTNNSELCRGDRVRVFHPDEIRATGLSSATLCVLGDFVPVPRSR